MPSVLSKYLVWSNSGIDRSKLDPIEDLMRTITLQKAWKNEIREDDHLLTLEKGRCYMNAMRVCCMIYRCAENKDFSALKIVAGCRWIKGSNDRWVGTDSDYNVCKHFWVEWNDDVYDVCWDKFNRAIIYRVSIPFYYSFNNIAKREECEWLVDGDKDKFNFQMKYSATSMNEPEGGDIIIEFERGD